MLPCVLTLLEAERRSIGGLAESACEAALIEQKPAESPEVI
jgi:hypothetical protein